jgi:hypothetical protein
VPPFGEITQTTPRYVSLVFCFLFYFVLIFATDLSEDMTIYDQAKQKQIIKKCIAEWENVHGKAALFKDNKPEFEAIMGIYEG